MNVYHCHLFWLEIDWLILTACQPVKDYALGNCICTPGQNLKTWYKRVEKYFDLACIVG